MQIVLELIFIKRQERNGVKIPEKLRVIRHCVFTLRCNNANV